MSSRTRLVMRSELCFKSFACYIDNLLHTFIIWKYLFSQGRVFLSVQLTLSLWEILTMSTLRERSLTECFLQKNLLFQQIPFSWRLNQFQLVIVENMRLHFYVILIVLKKVTLDIDGEDGNDFSPTNKVSFCKLNVLNVQDAWSLNVFSRNCNYITLDFSSRWK